ncbi:GNAT family N-acetyltransferase [Actinopolymorpha sp. B17G11]|uniref:GNAT family N-acetyltransferase n=1 Tax=Actinopolymorpha sp. B17G11 TaxID=3160861 RepID=UPI0032E39D63
MSTVRMTAEWSIEPATTAELADVAAVLEDAAAWLNERGVRQWPTCFPERLLLPAIESGQTWLVRAGADVVATVTVDHTDAAWDDLPTDAAYVHRMAVRHHGQQLGTWMLDWVTKVAIDEGRRAVRLDCVATNEDLCRYYERQGFRRMGDVTVGGMPGERLASKATQTVVRRYERVL